MITIGQLAAYAGVTVRAVRHYHQIGLLPEPERDSSGYRTYGAGDVVRLIRIRTLAEAGVPLSRVQQLLDATPEEFGEAVTRIDAELRARIRELTEHRRRIARLADGDSLAVPAEVTTYLDALREAGVSQAMVDGERDGWILVAARWGDQIPQLIADKISQLEDPRTLRFYLLLDELVAGGLDEQRLATLADLLIEMIEESAERGELEQQDEFMGDDGFVALLDAFATDAHPIVERLQELMAARGWTGWTRIERAEG